MNILRKCDVPAISRIVGEIVDSDAPEPSPEMVVEPVVIGYDAVWDPVKEAAEEEAGRCEALEAKLTPLVTKFFWLYNADDSITNEKLARDFASNFTVGETAEEQEKARAS